MKNLTLEKITAIMGDVHYTIFLNDIAIWTSFVIQADNDRFDNDCEKQAEKAKAQFLIYKQKLKAGLPVTEVLESFEIQN